MPMDREKPLAPNVKGEPSHTPFRKPIVIDGIARYAIKGKDVIQEENGFTVTYHNCAQDDGDSWLVDMRNCKMVTWR